MNDLELFEDIPCRYFRKPGPRNTKAVLEAVSRRARELGINRILVPTATGRTAFEALEILGSDMEIVAVSHATGFLKPDTQELSEKDRRELLAKGVRVLTCQHAFGGVGRGVRNKLDTFQVDEIIAFVLRTFGQGTKVAVELALMAADSGLVRTDQDVVSLGGTDKGVDTALVLRPANTFHLFKLKVREVICKPVRF